MTSSTGMLTYNTFRRPFLLFAITFSHLQANPRGVEELLRQKATPKHLAADTVKSNHSLATEELGSFLSPPSHKQKAVIIFIFGAQAKRHLVFFRRVLDEKLPPFRQNLTLKSTEPSQAMCPPIPLIMKGHSAENRINTTSVQVL